MKPAADLAAFAARLGHAFRRPELLREALTHASIAGPAPTVDLALIFGIGLVVLPGLLLAAAGWATRRSLPAPVEPLTAVIGRFIYALVPLGFGMWLAHYSFHFLTGGLTLVPVVQSFAADVGLYQGAVEWGLGPLTPGEWLFPIEALCLYAGAFGSLVAAMQIAHRRLAGETTPDLAWRSLRLIAESVLPALV